MNNIKILIVEDEFLIAKGLARQLERVVILLVKLFLLEKLLSNILKLHYPI